MNMTKIKIILTTLMIFIGLGLISYQVTYALFSDSASSTDNTFTAASEFPITFPSIQPGDVVINEIMWMGSQGNAADEWIELRNMTGNVIDLSGWLITDLGPGGADVTIATPSSIAANGFFLIANDDEDDSIIGVAPDMVVNISLANPGEQLILRDVGGTVIDTADIAGGGWFAGTDNPERSMERNAVPGDGTVAGSWHSASSSANLDLGASESATPRAPNSTP